MRIIYIFLINIFLLTSSNIIIRDLPYNIYHIEDMDQYENNCIQEGSEFFIRFQYNSENQMKFYLIIPKNITLFPIYISEFNEYPEETVLNNGITKNEIELKNQEEEDGQYIKYSFDINKTLTESYQVLYFQNNEELNYISFYAYSFALNTFSNLQMNHGLSIFSLKNESSYYLQFELSKSDGEKLQINTNADKAYLPDYELDIKCFLDEPSELEMTNVDVTWRKNLSYELSDDISKEYRIYEYEFYKNDQYCAIHIYNKNALDELYINIKMIEGDKLPIWAIVLIAIVGILLLIGIFYLIRKACIRSRDNPEDRQKAAACCIGICLCAACLASVAETGKN